MEDEEKKCACGMVLTEKTVCTCHPEVCINCCPCEPDCACGCQEKRDSVEDEEDDVSDDVEEGEGGNEEEEEEEDTDVDSEEV